MKKQKWLFGISLGGLVQSVVFAGLWTFSAHSSGFTTNQTLLFGAVSLLTFLSWNSAMYANNRLEEYLKTL